MLPTLHEQLFYGSVDVTFNIAPGMTFAVSPDAVWTNSNDITMALARFEPLKPLGDLVVPAIPATDVVLKTGEASSPWM